ncbi:MAG: tetratricopeptide repeat protein [Treponema sp.]|nr:tetratricopeptide repeat protein [Treponema sp.]
MKLVNRGFAAVVLKSVLISSLLISCGSTPKTVPHSPTIESTYTADPSEAVAITVPALKERTYFSSVNQDALSAVEKGDPESLHLAISLLRKDSSSYEEAEKILLNIAKSLMQILWPTQTVAVEIPPVTSANPYTGAIDSSRQGIYDMSTGNGDFLALVLPSLVLVTSESRNDYYDTARESLDRALELKEGSVLANYLRGVLSRRTNDYKGAINYFSKAQSAAADCVEVSYALADCYYKSNQSEKSLSVCDSILQKNPLYRPALKLSAEITFATNRIDECEQFVVRVLQQEPENAYYVLFRARILIQKNDYIRAASLLDVYGRSDGDGRDYLLLRAKVQKEWNRNLTAAASTVEKALALYPDDNEIILAAAAISAETGVKIGGVSAVELADKILAKDPKNVQALTIRVNELVRRKQWQEAYRASSNLRQTASSAQFSVHTHIDICLEADRKDEAWQIASSLYSQSPKDEQVIQSYIKVLVATDRRPEASRLIAQILPSSTSKMKSFLYYERSLLASSEDAVLVDLRSSLTANPRNRDALFRLYKIYYNKKEYRKAQYYLKQVVALSPNDDSLLKLNSELETLLGR